MEIGQKIKQLRHKCCLTQEQLASRLNISTQSVSKWETGITMPDISLLPALAGELGVTIDEIFDLTVNQKLHRIEKRLELDDELETSVFYEYAEFLNVQLQEHNDKTKIVSLLAHLYHHRILSDSRKVSQYAREAILLAPEIKDCQWLLQKTEGANAWDWNVSNHTAVINFYKTVIESDTITPQTPLPYYEIMDNLIADHRATEAEKYLTIYQTLPAHKPFLVPIYKAHIALAEYNLQKADAIMQEALKDFSNDGGFIFETAQFYAKTCRYKQAIEYYELSWQLEEKSKPRFTDALHGIAIIYEILGEYQKAIETYDRMIACVKDEWGYNNEDAAVIDVERLKQRVQKLIH